LRIFKMYKLLIAGMMGVAVMAEERPMIREEMVEYLKTHAKTWVPMEVSENPFAGMSFSDLQGRLGGFESANYGDIPEFDRVKENLASNFDGRTEWGSCVHEIRDQGGCGSCWAFGASESLSDRFCINSNGAIDVVLSPQYQVSCDGGQLGCGGGYLSTTWDFLQKTGTVKDSCMPYTSGKTGSEPRCPSSCSDGAAMNHYKCSNVEHARGVDKIKSFITEGPVEVQFHVYDDFYNYKSGIYTRKSFNYVGDHDVKVVGWGHDATTGMNYWIAQNSWGPAWGEDGFFRIHEGECSFDDTAYACTPDLSSGAIFVE